MQRISLKRLKGKSLDYRLITLLLLLLFFLPLLLVGIVFTARIDSLEEVVTGFADASDIEIVTEKFNKYDEIFAGYDSELQYLREKVDKLKKPKD